jgi:hypothetical protein
MKGNKKRPARDRQTLKFAEQQDAPIDRPKFVLNIHDYFQNHTSSGLQYRSMNVLLLMLLFY